MDLLQGPDEVVRREALHLDSHGVHEKVRGQVHELVRLARLQARDEVDEGGPKVCLQIGTASLQCQQSQRTSRQRKDARRDVLHHRLQQLHSPPFVDLRRDGPALSPSTVATCPDATICFSSSAGNALSSLTSPVTLPFCCHTAGWRSGEGEGFGSWPVHCACAAPAPARRSGTRKGCTL